MWRPDLGAWFDWDITNNKSREYFFVSNVVPLWTESYSMPKKSVASAVLGYLRDRSKYTSISSKFNTTRKKERKLISFYNYCRTMNLTVVAESSVR